MPSALPPLPAVDALAHGQNVIPISRPERPIDNAIAGMSHLPLRIPSRFPVSPSASFFRDSFAQGFPSQHRPFPLKPFRDPV